MSSIRPDYIIDMRQREGRISRGVHIGRSTTVSVVHADDDKSCLCSVQSRDVITSVLRSSLSFSTAYSSQRNIRQPNHTRPRPQVNLPPRDL
ncbi:hypothetical protein V491_06100 [Pseudogymnoascus sp. VKM F-3775]|nr:hypothetical protein V491_06100 [Pseudogymnoascus sp. VKM F-3775]